MAVHRAKTAPLQVQTKRATRDPFLGLDETNKTNPPEYRSRRNYEKQKAKRKPLRMTDSKSGGDFALGDVVKDWGRLEKELERWPSGDIKIVSPVVSPSDGLLYGQDSQGDPEGDLSVPPQGATPSISLLETPQTSTPHPPQEYQERPFMEKMIKGECPREVGIFVNFKTYGSINLRDHSFKAIINVILDWVATREELEWCVKQKKFIVDYNSDDFKKQTESERRRWFRYDRVEIVNQIELTLIKPWGAPKLFLTNDGQYVFETSCDIRGEFRENFELENFPMDCQELQMTFKHLDDSMGKMLFCPTRFCPYSLKVIRDTLSNQDWSLAKPWVHYSLTCPDASVKGKVYSQFKCLIELERNWTAYLPRIFLVLACFSFGVLFVFAIPDTPELLESRLALSLGYLLTSVAFQLYAQRDLPIVPYLTFLDKFILANFLYMLFVQVMLVTPYFFSILGALKSSLDWLKTDNGENGKVDGRGKEDVLLFFICLAVWVILMLTLTCMGKRAYRLEQKKLISHTPVFFAPERVEKCGDHVKLTDDYPRWCNRHKENLRCDTQGDGADTDGKMQPMEIQGRGDRVDTPVEVGLKVD